MKMKKILYTFLGVAVLGFSSCEDEFLNTEFTDGIDKETATELAQTDPQALNGYLRGIFTHMVSSDITGAGAHDDFSYMAVMHATDLMGETMVQSKSHWFTYDYGHDNRQDNYRRTSANWKTFYTIIAKANEVIDFFPEVPEDAGSKGILGQAYALRGMSYYYLIQLYQFTNTSDPSIMDLPGVPMRYSSVEIEENGWTEEEVAQFQGRNTLGDVYAQIESDLEYAVELLDAGYSRSAKYFVDSSVAKGLLARYYLLAGKWDLAAATANAARQGYPIMGESGLHDGFLDISNSEWMWGFDHTTETQTTYASFFSHISNLAPGYAGINYAPRLIDARLYSRIPDTDYRKSLFTGSEGPSEEQLSVATTTASQTPYANLKFGDDGNWTMDYVYMRAAEMVLIEAEAKAQSGDESGAAETLSVLMANRDPEWNQTSVSVEDVYLQRRIELWGEGFEYFDLKRLNKGINRDYEGSNHRLPLVVEAGANEWVYKIPVNEIQENPQINPEDNNK